MKTPIIFILFIITSFFTQAQSSSQSDKDGTYTIVDNDGNKKVMTFIGGKLHGEVHVYNASGALIEKRQFINGQRHGEWSFWNETGNKTATLRYLEGMKDGEWKLFNDNGTLKAEMNYQAGIKSGIWKSYDLQGKLIASRDYGLALDPSDLLTNKH